MKVVSIDQFMSWLLKTAANQVVVRIITEIYLPPKEGLKQVTRIDVLTIPKGYDEDLVLLSQVVYEPLDKLAFCGKVIETIRFRDDLGQRKLRRMCEDWMLRQLPWLVMEQLAVCRFNSQARDQFTPLRNFHTIFHLAYLCGKVSERASANDHEAVLYQLIQPRLFAFVQEMKDNREKALRFIA